MRNNFRIKITSFDQPNLPTSHSVIEEYIEDVCVEREEDGHAQELVPVHAAQENHDLECNQDTLHGQEPGVDVMPCTEEHLREDGREGGREIAISERNCAYNLTQYY